MAKNSDMFNDEIDLLDYVRIIIKRKTTVMSFFTLSALILNYFLYLSPQLYEAKSLIRVGFIVKPLMTVQDAGYLLKKNGLCIVSSLRPQSSISLTHLLLIYNNGKIVFKKEGNSEFVSISVIEKNSSRAIDISSAIATMLVDEGKKIYNKEKQIVNSQIQEYEAERKMINQQLISLKDSLAKQESISRVDSLQELKNFYENKYKPLLDKILSLKEALWRSRGFYVVTLANTSLFYNILTFDQIFAILALSLILGITFAFFQEFWSNNFKTKK